MVELVQLVQLVMGWVARIVVLGLLSGCGGDDGGSGSQIDARCTHVIGYSQVAQWYEQAGRFEELVVDSEGD